MLESKTRESTFIPTLFVCRGTSGAGVTTSISKVLEENLALKAPAQFTTRQLRPSEQHGDVYYSVTNEQLSKIQHLIALQGEIYGNKYGFFIPAIQQIIRKITSGNNLIVDIVNTPPEIKKVVDLSIPIVSIFFAPQTPEVCIQRIIKRAIKSGASLSEETVLRRALDNRTSIQSVAGSYDYWVNTTVFESIMPQLISIITCSNLSSQPSPNTTHIPSSPEAIRQLKTAFNEDPTFLVHCEYENNFNHA